MNILISTFKTTIKTYQLKMEFEIIFVIVGLYQLYPFLQKFLKNKLKRLCNYLNKYKLMSDAQCTENASKLPTKQNPQTREYH